MSDWKTNIECCGNCAFWPLKPYQHDWKGAEPLGISGYATDGTVSECRRYAPRQPQYDEYSPGSNRAFPKTERTDFCGEFTPRGGQ